MQSSQQSLASGFRHLSPAMLATGDTADCFAGLPADATRGQVLAAFKRAAPYLGIQGCLVHFIDLLMSWSREQDWEDGARPIVWPGNRILQEELGLGRTQVKARIRNCIELGLINPVDSPCGKRYGRRDERGRIIEAYGFDLSPLAVRFAEFAAAADDARADRQARGALRRRLTIARKAVQQLAETGQQYDVAGEDWPALARLARDRAAVAREAETVAELETAAEILEGHQKAAESLVKDALLSVKTDPAPSEHRPRITTTNHPSSDESDTSVDEDEQRRSTDRQDAGLPKRAGSKAWQKKPPSPGTCRSRPDSAKGETAFDEAAIGIYPHHLTEISASIEACLGREEPTWPNLVEAAFVLRHDLGISQHAWAEACRRMGRNMAAACIALIDGKRQEIASPGGYLRAMTTKYDHGELNLARSYYGLRQGSRRLH